MPVFGSGSAMAVLNSASLLVSQPRIGRPPHLVTRRGLYPISRPIGRLFPHLASSDRQCNAPHRSPLPDHRDARSWPGWSFHRRRTCGEVHVPLDDCARAVVQTCDQVGRGPAGGRAPERSLRGQAAAPRAMPSRMTTRTLAVGGITALPPGNVTGTSGRLAPISPIRAQWRANIVKQARLTLTNHCVTPVFQRQHIQQNELFRGLRDFEQRRELDRQPTRPVDAFYS